VQSQNKTTKEERENPVYLTYVKKPINGEITCISLSRFFLLLMGFGKYFLVREGVTLCVVIPKFRPACMIPQYAQLVGFDKDEHIRHPITFV
jgi:hypothetical protein